MCLPCKYKYKLSWPSFLRKLKPKTILTECFIEDLDFPDVNANYIVCDV